MIPTIPENETVHLVQLAREMVTHAVGSSNPDRLLFSNVVIALDASAFTIRQLSAEVKRLREELDAKRQ